MEKGINKMKDYTSIKITKEEAPHVLLAIVSCLDNSLYIEPETEKALISVYDKIQEAFGKEDI